MHNKDQALDAIVDIIRDGEKLTQSFGAEFEHFLVDGETGKTYSYNEPNGVREVLIKLKALGWETDDKDDEILHLHRLDADITLEPAGQIELSIYPKTTIEELNLCYLRFVDDIKRAIEPNQRLVSLGYQPKSSVKDMPFIPKKRYEYMSNYFLSKGKYAHNMMKGTASTQVAIDFKNEQDCFEKFKLFNVLSPFIFTYFDSAPIFESKPIMSYATRMQIWENTDSDRSGICICAFNDNLTYKCYADTVLSIPPILIPKDGKMEFTGDETGYELAAENDFDKAAYEHIMTMLFPDVRLKHFLEIRMADAMPYPLNIGYVDFIQTLAYNDGLKAKYLAWAKSVDFASLVALKKDIVNLGKNSIYQSKTIAEFMDKLLDEAAAISGSRYINALRDAYSNPTAYVDTLKDLSIKALIERSAV